MKILISPDSYKGCLSAKKVAAAMAAGFGSVFPEAEIYELPVADGGEGTVESMVDATRGTFKKNRVRGPLGAPVEAIWGLLGDNETAVIEMASASGLPLLTKEERNPFLASTYGVGELITEALKLSVKKIILGIGGSATNDGGSGMARALGVKFLDKNGEKIAEGGGALAQLHSLDLNDLDLRLNDTEILVACDVDNPLCGVRGASAVFGPQKGADDAMVKELDAALSQYADIAEEALAKKVRNLPGSGAAGGLGAGLMFFTKAELKPGIDIVMQALDVESFVKKADLVFTGEGSTDFQTAYGKAPVGVAQLAKKNGVPVICISGSFGKDYSVIYKNGISAIMSCPLGPISLERSMEEAETLVFSAAERAARFLKVGMGLC